MSPILLLAAMLSPQAVPAAPPPPPADLTLPPETARVVLIAEGRGTQNYTCSALRSGYAWTLTAPEAQLFNLATGKPIGHHGAGPTWTLDDGSSTHGTLVASKSGDAATDVPWLLLRSESTASPAGTLSPVTLVRRYNTHGGAAPATGCSASQAGVGFKVPYTATYAFYTEGPSLTRP